ncbi:hypothetical protein Cgig2_029087 [Carnegiea gigantea]|uniref:Uncharacterized protein n=1 Tax=Carnegiea gigantea TaxID=171969 RepID=A0A9Q1QF39_9CARY|nr:hypothetical protein Cgig2_029087 [Carnegiea gigantea]
MKVLIVASIFQTIQGNIILSLESCEYRITVKEIGPASQVLHRACKKTGFPFMEAKDSNNDVVGFEDIDDHWDDATKSDTGKKANFDAEVEDSAVQESSNFQNNSNLMQEVERSMDNSIRAGSNNYVTRTKIVCFSHDGCSKKISKITRQLQALENDHENIDHHHLNAENSHPPPSFERCINDGLDHSKTLEDGRDLLGHQTQEDFQGNDEPSKPLGRESRIDVDAAVSGPAEAATNVCSVWATTEFSNSRPAPRPDLSPLPRPLRSPWPRPRAPQLASN